MLFVLTDYIWEERSSIHYQLLQIHIDKRVSTSDCMESVYITVKVTIKGGGFQG